MIRKLRVAFLVSIIVNVLLAGVILGVLPRHFYSKPDGRESFRADIERLPEPARTRFRQKVDAFRASPLRRQIAEARNDAIRLLAADPFDEAAYDRAVGKINELRLQMSKRMSEDMKEIVKGLPPDQRHAVAAILKRPPSSED